MKIKFQSVLASTLFLFSIISTQSVYAATVWNGPEVFFEKNTDGQDFITDQVILARGFTAGIYNAAQESGFSSGSPADTEWAFANNLNVGKDVSAANYQDLFFTDWRSAVKSNPPSVVGVDAVLHLISEDIFIDIRFTDWGIGPDSGTNFAYYRASEVPLPGALGFFILSVGLLIFNFAIGKR